MTGADNAVFVAVDLLRLIQRSHSCNHLRTGAESTQRHTQITRKLHLDNKENIKDAELYFGDGTAPACGLLQATPYGGHPPAAPGEETPSCS